MTESSGKKISPIVSAVMSSDESRGNTSTKERNLSLSTLNVKKFKKTKRENQAKLLKDLEEMINPANTSLKAHTIINFSNSSTHESSICSNKSNSQTSQKYLIDYPFKPIKHKAQSYVIWSIVHKSITVFFNVLLIVPVIIYLSIILPISWLFRLTFQLFHICHMTSASKYQDSIPEFLSPIELFWLLNSNLIDSAGFRKKQNAIGSCLLFIEGPITKSNLKNLIKTKVIESEQRSNQKNFVRFTQRLYNLWAYGYVWLDCDEAVFNLDEHISVIDDDADVIKTDDDLQVYVSNLITNHEFDIQKPLWKIYCKQNFVLSEESDQSVREKGTVVIFLFHMCFADGISLIRMLFKSLIDNRNAVDIKPRFASSRFKLEFFQQFFCNLHRVFSSLLFNRSDKNPLHRDHYKSQAFKDLRSFPVDAEHRQAKHSRTLQQKLVKNQTSNKMVRRVLWSQPFSSIAFNRLKLITRTKINDFFLSLVSNILREYLQSKGINNPRDMHCLIPVDLSCNKYPAKLRNFTTLSTVKVPSNTEGAVPSLWKTRSIMNKIKSSGDYFFIYFVMCFLFKSLPNRIAAFLSRCLINKSTFLATSLGTGDASLSTVFLCSQNVKQMIIIHPTICNIGISFSFMNYGEDVRLAIMIDPEIIKNPELIVNEFNKKLDVLNKLLSGRRIPGEVRRPMRCSIAQPTLVKKQELSVKGEEEADLLRVKLNRIYGEIQVLSDYCDKLDPSSTDFNNLKQLALIKREKYKAEFRVILGKLQDKQFSSQVVTSDEEEEMDEKDRSRLRSLSKSSSTISNISIKPSSRNNSAVHEAVSMSATSLTHTQQQNSAIDQT